jgi:hypothetical protein
MKRRCTGCGNIKDESEFSWKIKGKRRSAKCKVCHSEYRKKHYENNKGKYLEKAKIRNKRHSRELAKKVFEYLSSHSCVDCNESDPVVLEFDHRDRAKKKFSIANAVRNANSWDTILKEIEKCDVRCANCHRRMTAKRAGWFRYEFSI